jgi:hypothetical protein
MQRVAVVGSGGAGKSRFSRAGVTVNRARSAAKLTGQSRASAASPPAAPSSSTWRHLLQRLHDVQL